MTKRTKVQLFKQIRKAHAGPESPSICELSRMSFVSKEVCCVVSVWSRGVAKLWGLK